VAVRVTAAVDQEEKMIGPSETRWRDELVINSYADYPAVERAVDLLSDRGFPVQTVRVVGRDVRIVEQITGRLTPWRAAGAGALSGMWFGAMIGLVLGLVTPYVFAPLLWGVLLGAVFGAVFAGVAQLATRGRRDFASTRGMVAGSYELIVAGDTYQRAVAILSQAGELPAESRAGAAGDHVPSG
jgi:hypothetical protein